MKNFTLADRKRNLAGFGQVKNDWDLSWIENTVEGGGGGGGTSTPFTLAFSSSPTFVLANGSPQNLTLTGNVTSSALTGGIEGARMVMRILQDATGGRTFVWPTNIRLDPSFVVDSRANYATILDLEYNNSKWEPVAAPTSVPLP